MVIILQGLAILGAFLLERIRKMEAWLREIIEKFNTVGTVLNVSSLVLLFYGMSLKNMSLTVVSLIGCFIGGVSSLGSMIILYLTEEK